AVLGQFDTRNVHVPGLAISINGRGVVLTVHGHRHRVASLDVFTHGTGDGHEIGRATRRERVVTGEGAECYRGFRQVGVYTIATVGFSACGVFGCVFGLSLRVRIAVLGQFGTRNVYVPGLTVSVNGGRVILAVHGHSDGIAGLDVFTHGTGDGHVGLGLSLVDHIVTGNGVDRDGGFGQIGIDTVATVSLSTGGVTRCIFGLNLGVYVRTSSQRSPRNVHVPRGSEERRGASAR